MAYTGRFRDNTFEESRTVPARPLVHALADSPAGPLLARLAQVQRLTRSLHDAVGRLAPDFNASDPSACELREGVLLLNARSAAQAAKLRQGIPGLLRLLHQTGAQVTEIRVKVQPARMSYPEEANPAAQGAGNAAVAAAEPPKPASPALRALADTLARELPESALKAAAERLQAALRRHGR